ncbi:MAG: metallophosphoesterase [Bacteroidales bacterium]|nr:metallophosphoesterase [Bacteroidales bacterium]
MKHTVMFIFIIVVTLIYGAVSWYVFSRGVRALEGTVYLRIFKWSFWLIAATFIIGQVLERGNPGLFARVITHIGSVWLAFFFYLLLFVVIVDIFRIFQHFFNIFPASLTSGLLSGNMLFVYALSFAFMVTVGGYINARIPKIKEIDITIDKKQGENRKLKIVLATDVHLGVILGNRRAEKLVEQINQQNADIVLFGGDLVDHNPIPVVKNNIGGHFETIKSRFGVFAITGNHEFIGNADVSADYFLKHGVKYLRDTIITIENILQIAGREDKEKLRFAGLERKPLEDLQKDRDEKLPLILLDHQPVEYAQVENNGIGLMLSGHTHKGQLWPFGFFTNLLYENHYGLIKKGSTWFYTSSGYGTWGPPVRTSNRPELVVINLTLE